MVHHPVLATDPTCWLHTCLSRDPCLISRIEQAICLAHHQFGSLDEHPVDRTREGPCAGGFAFLVAVGDLPHGGCRRCRREAQLTEAPQNWISLAWQSGALRCKIPGRQYQGAHGRREGLEPCHQREAARRVGRKGYQGRLPGRCPREGRPAVLSEPSAPCPRPGGAQASVRPRLRPDRHRCGHCRAFLQAPCPRALAGLWSAARSARDWAPPFTRKARR